MKKKKDVVLENYLDYLNEILPALAVAGFAGQLLFGTIVDKALLMSWRAASAPFSQASRKCGVFKTGPERNLCMAKIKMAALSKQEAILRQVESNCKKQKNPEKCIGKIKEKLEMHQRKIQMMKDSILAYQKEIEDEKREKELKQAQKESAKEKI